MRAYIALAQKSFQRQVTYRAATFAGLLTNLFFGALRAAVMVALYGEREIVSGISLQAAVTYTGISQAVIGFLSLFSWVELMNSVYSGTIATDLLKPMDYFRYWLAQDSGRAIAQFTLRSLPIIGGYALLFDIVYPKSIVQICGLIVALVLAWLVSFCYRFIVNLSAFWIPNSTGIIRFAYTLVWFFSGFLMPLRFFPEWFVNICNLTPFPSMVNTIIEIYLGVVTGKQLVMAIGMQVFWAVLLLLLGRLILGAGIRRLEILGG